MELSERDNLIGYISDAHKDAYGFRPRHFNYDGMSLKDLQKLAERLSLEVQETIKREEKEAEEAAKRFEIAIQEVIENGAGDRETAIRWIAQAEGKGIDSSYLCFLLEVPYSYENEFKQVLGV